MAKKLWPYVIDTNILIDFNICALIPLLFKLPHEISTLDIIVGELDSIEEDFLVKNGLRICELSGERVLETRDLCEYHPTISPKDIMAMVLAKAINGILLTRDKALIKLSRKHRVKTLGTLELLEEMTNFGITPPDKTILAVSTLIGKFRIQESQETIDFIEHHKISSQKH